LARGPGAGVVDWTTVSWRAIDPQLTQRMLTAWDKHLTHPSLPRTLAAQLRDAGFGFTAVRRS
jgi:hypothetical protein